MAPRKEKLKQTMAEDRKRLLLRARKWPFATWMKGAVVAAGVYFGFTTGDGGIVHVIVLGIVGLVLADVLKKVFGQLENRVSAKLYYMANQIEIVEQSDVKDKTATVPNTLLDEFVLDYCGGHPTWRVDKAPFGSLQIFERSLVFKNLKNRFRMPMARFNRVTLETVVQVRIRHLPDVVLPNAGVSRNKTMAALWATIRKRQRYIVLDYTDDVGSLRHVVFWPRAGNPRYAKQVKEALDSAARRSAKDRTNRGVEGIGSLQPAAGASEPSAAAGRGQAAPPDELKKTIAARSPNRTLYGKGAVSKEMLEAASRASAASQLEPTLTGLLGAPLAAKLCPFCKFSLKDPVVTCSTCGSELHEGCWKANFGCSTKDCKGKPEKPGAGSAAASLAGDEGGGVAVVTEIMYQVVLASAGRDDAEREAVAAQMANLFSLPLDRCVQILQKVPTIAKRNVSKSEAEALAARFSEIGALAKVQRMPDA